MAYVIAEPCVGTCDTACVNVCPVDAIHGPLPADDIASLPRPAREKLQLYIDPEACICCAACEPECPVDAIFDEDDLPPAWAEYREINARFFAEGHGR
ncbi:Ferredoxin [Minicystis rosea]|nr:Ferredoxin [Minicystis rosea]